MINLNFSRSLIFILIDDFFFYLSVYVALVVKYWKYTNKRERIRLVYSLPRIHSAVLYKQNQYKITIYPHLPLLADTPGQVCVGHSGCRGDVQVCYIVVLSWVVDMAHENKHNKINIILIQIQCFWCFFLWQCSR